MTKEFLKKEEIQLINGGYLSNKDGQPIYNEAFYNAQKRAEFVVTFATMAKDKDFEGKEAYSVEQLREEVYTKLNDKNIKEFVPVPKVPKQTITNKLKDEALNFIEFQDNKTNINKLNKVLSQFEIIDEFEEFGLFFEQEICKLNKIYTMTEIVKAVTPVINLFN